MCDHTRLSIIYMNRVDSKLKNFVSSNMEAKTVLYLIAAVIFLRVDVDAQIEVEDMRFFTVTDCVGQYYNINELKCAPCGINSAPTSAGTACACIDGSRYNYNITAGKYWPYCSNCSSGITSTDKWTCLDCADPPCTCTGSDLQTALFFSGEVALSEEEASLLQCFSCVPGTFARDGKCEPCGQKQAMNSENSSVSCSCPADRIHDNLCFPQGIINSNGISYTIQIQAGNHRYMQNHLLAAYGMCSAYNNDTACQLLANMCALQYGSRQYLSSSTIKDACSLLNQAVGTAKPSLWFTQSTILDATYLNSRVHYARSQAIDIYLAVYAMNGTFLQLRSAQDGWLQICPDQTNVLNAAFQFGTAFSQQCTINPNNVASNLKNVFFVPYLRYVVDSLYYLYPIPVVLTQLVDASGNRPNQLPFSDRSSWVLVNRFFLVDDTPIQQADAVVSSTRYAAEMTLNIRLMNDRSSFRAGSIYPPYLTITYSSAASGKDLSASFSVSYSQDWTAFQSGYLIAVGVSAGLGVLFAIIRTWSWSKRAGKLSIDCVSLLKFIAYMCRYVANLFIASSFTSSLVLLCICKSQGEVTALVPSSDVENSIFFVLYVALALKTIDLAHLIIMQCTIDVFFIDWEKPKKDVDRNLTARKARVGNNSTDSRSIMVGGNAWRTTMVANEWCEMQTYRKINVGFQMLLVLLLLDGVGLINFASMDGGGYTVWPDSVYRPSFSRVFRYALVGSMYIGVGVLQWFYTTFYYEPVSHDTLNMFTDTCSVANISVIILAQRLFGYYIHGRSAHGYADTTLRELVIQLKKEELGLVGHRGLEPGSDQQVYTITIPASLRKAVDKVYAQITLHTGVQSGNAGPEAGTDGTTVLSEQEAHTFEMYRHLNELLQNFIDHGLPRVSDYGIKPRNCVEDLMDIELDAASDSYSYFYPDPDGNIFGRIMFHGSEFTLFLFDLALICSMDVIVGTSTVAVAAFITYVITLFYTKMHEEFSKRNVSKKTLIAPSFLA